LDECIRGKRIPNGLILLISGVPGVGKTTISYNLLKQLPEFRIIEETDILRDALRGYSAMLVQKYGTALEEILRDTEIYSNQKLLSFSEAKQQCCLMKTSIEYIIARQQRKGICTIINGVHIVPEVLVELLNNPLIRFVNLYVTSEENLQERLKKRDSSSYMLQHIPFIYNTNIDLLNSTQKLASVHSHSVFNINVTSLDVDMTIQQVLTYITSQT